MGTKCWSVSLCLSIEAETEEEALKKFSKRVERGVYHRDSIDIEFEIETE